MTQLSNFHQPIRGQIFPEFTIPPEELQVAPGHEFFRLG
jgi:hypothetical protein